MRRFIALLIALSLACSGFAMAESMDLSSMRLEDLYALYQQVALEIAARQDITRANRIGRGSYLVGKDIKAGYYDFVCLDTDRFEWGDPDNDIYIYTVIDNNPASKGERIFWEQRFEIGAHVTFNLTEGTLLEIDGCSGTLTSITPDWMP